MPPIPPSRICSWLAGMVLIGLLAACGSSPTTPGTTAPVPPTQTSCPTANAGRPAVFAPLTLGHDQALLYTVQTQGSTTISRYDARTGAKTVIVRFSHETISDPQISADGQWLLFVTSNSANGPGKLQLMRMDGQQRQTLYCGSIDGPVQWSADQQMVSFYTYSGTDKKYGLNLLNLQTGSVQRELVIDPVPFYGVVTWLDSTHLYLHSLVPEDPGSDIFILDTSKGPDQKPGDLIPVFQTQNLLGGPYAFVAFDRSSDGKALFVSVYSRLQGSSDTPAAPSSIEIVPPTGGTARVLYTSSTLAIPALRVINGNSLCLLVENAATNTGQNGLWKMNTDGTHLMRLAAFGNGTVGNFNAITQVPWSNFSRDRSLYAIVTTTAHGSTSTASLLLGSLQGGAPSTIASLNTSNAQLALVGWTTE